MDLGKIYEIFCGGSTEEDKSKSGNFSYQKISLKSKKRNRKNRVSVSSPASCVYSKLNMLAGDSSCGHSLFSGEFTEDDDPIRVSSRMTTLKILAYAAVAKVFDEESGDGDANKKKWNTLLIDAKLKFTNCVDVPKKQRSLRHRSTTRWYSICLTEPQNPNPDDDGEEYAPSSSTCVTVSKKRRRINVSKEEGEMRSSKKRKTVVRRRLDPVLPTQPTTVPEWLVNVMAREGNGYDPKLIIAKELFKSDLEPQQARLSMPLKQVISSDFLTAEETRIIHQQSVLKNRREGVSVVLIDPLLNKHVVDLRKWQMNGSWNYVFVDGWKNVVAMNSSKDNNNRFEIGVVFPVWSFRSGDGKLCFALLPPN